MIRKRLEIMANIQNLIPAKKGEIRNPYGKAKGVKNRSTVARQILELTCKLPKKQFDMLKIIYPDLTESMTNEEVMTIVQTGKAIMKADTQSYEKILDSAYGKPSQDITINPETLDDETLAALYNQLNDNTESNE